MKSKLNTQVFTNLLKGKLTERRRLSMSKLLARFCDEVMNNAPIEDGHIHEAIITAMAEFSGELYGKDFNSVVRKHLSSRSNDPEASAATHTAIGEVGDELLATLKISLPFVRALEYGYLIRVGDKNKNRGPKVIPVTRPTEKGPLYGARAAKGSFGGLKAANRKSIKDFDRSIIRKGVGILVWQENGVTKRALFRRPKAYRFWGKAFTAIRTLARSLKLKKASS